MEREDKKKRGPVPEAIKIDKPWDEAVKAALGKKRPAEGWPKPEKPKKGTR